ncbi:MAG: hypothetical protein AAGD25_08250 [Cyanobacteria bacterium P01_F01_bin.150]
MTTLLKTLGLVFALLAVIALPIVLPAWQVEIVGDWRVVFLSVGYFTFFLGTVWRVVRYELHWSSECRNPGEPGGH